MTRPRTTQASTTCSSASAKRPKLARNGGLSVVSLAPKSTSLLCGQ
jgi:hypothetical protein